MKIEMLKYEDLTEQEKEEAPNNGFGCKYANYIRISYDGKTIALYSDAMEPEDATFKRDLAWIPALLKKCCFKKEPEGFAWFWESKMKKVVINTKYGGFSLSDEAKIFIKPLKESMFNAFPNKEENRTHPKLIECVEKLGSAASGDFCELKIVEIPDNIKWYIQEFDGKEKICEEHRTWE